MSTTLSSSRQQPGRLSRERDLNLVWLPVDSLQANRRNARTHSRKQIRMLAASIERFGFTSPVVIDDARMILAGHGRVEAARSLGLTEVPTLRLTHLTAAQKRAYILADNAIAMKAGWDRELLAVELGELIELLPAEGLDVSLTGFEAAEIDLVLADMQETAPDPDDAVPEAPDTPVSRRGELWILGKHRLLCGDARSRDDVLRLVEDRKMQAVFTDPPYNVRVRDIVGRSRTRHPEFAFASGEMNSQEFRDFLATTLGHTAQVSAPGALHYVCMDWRHLAELLGATASLYGAMLNLCVWTKSNAGQGSFYRSQHELVGVFRVGANPHANNIELGRHGRNRSNVWAYAGVNSLGRGRMDALASHPTVKPVQLVADALLDCTRRGDFVLDPFGGSGTTLLAAEKVGRRAFLLEYEPRYVDVAIRRWQQATKRDAIREEDGRTFDDIAEDLARRPPEEEPGSQPQSTADDPGAGDWTSLYASTDSVRGA
jgi:DNA modification methylase